MILASALDLFELNIESLDSESIKKQYRKLMAKYHPDNVNGDITKSQEVNEAKEILIEALKSIEAIRNTNKIDTNILSFEQLEKLYQDKKIVIKKNDKEVEILRSDLSKENTYVIIQVTVEYLDRTEHFTKTCHIKNVVDRQFDIVCDLKVQSSGALPVKINFFNKEFNFTISSGGLNLPVTTPNNLKVIIQLKKVIIENKYKNTSNDEIEHKSSVQNSESKDTIIKVVHPEYTFAGVRDKNGMELVTGYRFKTDDDKIAVVESFGLKIPGAFTFKYLNIEDEGGHLLSELSSNKITLIR